MRPAPRSSQLNPGTTGSIFKEKTMTPRMNLFQMAPEGSTAMLAVEASIE